ncbi:MAG: FHA domain-containing protein, partial [Blastocatellia bacterium]
GQAAPPTGAAPPPDQHTIVMSSTPVASPPKSGRLLLIMEGGDVGETFQLRPTETGIGRVDGDIKFPHDGYMSSRHARILQRNGRFFLIDNNSRNGTFVKIHQEVELHGGDVVLIGKQLFRFEADE